MVARTQMFTKLTVLDLTEKKLALSFIAHEFVDGQLPPLPPPPSPHIHLASTSRPPRVHLTSTSRPPHVHLASTSHPPEVIHVIRVPRPSLFFFFHRSSAFVYYTERKPKNKNRGVLGTHAGTGQLAGMEVLILWDLLKPMKSQ